MNDVVVRRVCGRVDVVVEMWLLQRARVYVWCVKLSLLNACTHTDADLVHSRAHRKSTRTPKGLSVCVCVWI